MAAILSHGRPVIPAALALEARRLVNGDPRPWPVKQTRRAVHINRRDNKDARQIGLVSSQQFILVMIGLDDDMGFDERAWFADGDGNASYE